MINSNKKLLSVLKGEKFDVPPVWLMRQAGRYLPEYKKTRVLAGSFLDLCYNPKLAAEVTLQPLKRFDLDAAILFADILLIPNALGLNLEFKEGEGPILDTINDHTDVLNLIKTNAIHNTLSPVYDAVSLIKSQLHKNITLIGFAGSPWTVSTYMIEGRGSKDHQKTKTFLAQHPESFDILISKITEATVDYLSKQIEAGADVVKLFDSWAGSLPGSLVEKYSLKPMKEIAERLKGIFPDVQIIVFPRGVGPHYTKFSQISAFDCVALDSNLPLPWAKENVQKNIVVQGNLDPSFLVSGGRMMIEEIQNIKKMFSDGGHIFNLGHGITPNADIKNVETLIDTLHK